MMERLPLSIKVDNESSLYTDLIQPKREGRELTTFIVELLELYHRDEEVQARLREHIAESNPYTEIQERLKELNKKHEKNVTSSRFISQFTEIEREKYEQGQERDEGVERESEEEAVDKLVDRLVPKLREAMGIEEGMKEKEARIKELEAKLAEVESSGQTSIGVEEGKEREEVKEEKAEDIIEVEESSPRVIVGIEKEVEEVKEVEVKEVEVKEEKSEEKPRVTSAFAKMGRSI